MHNSSSNLLMSDLLAQNLQLFQEGTLAVLGPSGIQESQDYLSLFHVQHFPILNVSSQNLLLHWLLSHTLLLLPERFEWSAVLLRYPLVHSLNPLSILLLLLP